MLCAVCFPGSQIFLTTCCWGMHRLHLLLEGLCSLLLLRRLQYCRAFTGISPYALFGWSSQTWLLCPGITKLAGVPKPFSWDDLTTPASNCSGVMFKAFPDTKGHCHSQGLVQCTPQKEGRKISIENWGDIQSCERHNERKTARKWLYNEAKSRLLGP